MTAEIKAIPTEYRGVQLKSRLEAQAAFLFDKLGWEWRYEPASFMLPNGVSYTPDFLLPGQNAVLECRGYRNEKGTKQIIGFCDLVTAGLEMELYPEEYPGSKEKVCLYVVLYGERAPFALQADGLWSRSLAIVKCRECGWNIPSLERGAPFSSTYFDLFCPSCIGPMSSIEHKDWDGHSSLIGSAIVSTEAGKILVNGVGVEGFNG